MIVEGGDWDNTKGILNACLATRELVPEGTMSRETLSKVSRVTTKCSLGNVVN